MQQAIYNALYPIHFSDLETALLPYFLFVAYGSIVLWCRSCTNSALPALQPLQDEPEVEIGRDYVLSVPCPWSGDLMASQFDREVRTRKSKSRSAAQVIALEMERTEPTCEG